MSDEKYILAFDAGTTSSRAIVFDRDGRIRGLARAEIPQHFPRPGWVEHNPDDLWQTQLETARGALRAADVRAADIAAIGISNQRETALLWDRATGRPVHNAVVWQDRRTAAICAELRAGGHEPTVRRLTGLLLDPYFSATKIGWMLDRVPGLRARAERGEIAFGTVDSWLIWNLTGGKRHVTDVTNASRTLLFDIEALGWSAAMLTLFGVPGEVLPDVLPSTAAFGSSLPELFGAPIPISGVAGDQQAALVGQAGLRRGLMKNTYGTGSFVLFNTGDRIARSSAGLLSTIAYGFEPGRVEYALEGSIFVTGAAVQWLRDGLGIIDRSSDIEALARAATDSGDVFFVPAFTGLGAPYWDPYARGLIVGITRGTTRAHIARAALEAMAYQSADVIAAMQRDADLGLTELRVDGGAAVSDIAMQFQADLLGVDVVRSQNTETTALGAAYLAGLQAGFWPDTQAVARHWRPGRRFVPAVAPSRRAELLEGWTRALNLSRGWAVDPQDGTGATSERT